MILEGVKDCIESNWPLIRVSQIASCGAHSPCRDQNWRRNKLRAIWRMKNLNCDVRKHFVITLAPMIMVLAQLMILKLIREHGWKTSGTGERSSWWKMNSILQMMGSASHAVQVETVWTKLGKDHKEGINKFDICQLMSILQGQFVFFNVLFHA